MSTSTHPIVPEEVMAFLDGELSEAGAHVVSSHLQQCAECNAIAEKFRGTSRSLAQWSVPAVSKAMEESVKESADKKGPSGEIGTPNIFIRTSFWTRKQWTVGIGATAAVLLLLLAVAIPMSERHGMSVDNARLNIQEYAQLTEKGKMVVSPLNAVPYARRLPQQAVGTGSWSRRFDRSGAELDRICGGRFADVSRWSPTRRAGDRLTHPATRADDCPGSLPVDRDKRLRRVAHRAGCDPCAASWLRC